MLKNNYSSRYGSNMFDNTQGAAAAAKQPLVGVPGIHSSSEPNKLGTIFDIHEQPFKLRKSIVEMADDHTTTPFTISRGFAVIAGLVLTILGSVIGAWIYSLNGAMSYQTVVNRVGTAETRIDKMENAVTDLQSLKITANDLKNDVKAIKEKQADAEPDRKKVMNDIADIRILLAQKGLQPQQ